MSKHNTDYHVSGDQEVVYKKVGKRRLFSNPDADEAREHFKTQSRRMVDKTTMRQGNILKHSRDAWLIKPLLLKMQLQT